MYQCDVCDKAFPSPCNLVIHYRTHTDERPFTCNVCKKRFRQKGHLTDHLKLHSDEQSYKCLVCGQGFRQSSGLRNHRAKVHPLELPKRRGRPRRPKPETVTNGEASEQQTVDVDVESLHKCDICDETFSTVTKLENHITWHSMRKRYKCTVCSRIFKHLSIFKKHQKLHAERQKKCPKQPTNMFDDETQNPEKNKPSRTVVPFCETCKKTFSSKFSLTRHVNEYHQGVKRRKNVNKTRDMQIKKKHQCRVCRKKFANTHSLSVHCRRIHTMKAHKCYICGKAYGMLSDLKCHYKSHHLPYECDICGKPFQYQSKLNEHSAIHTKQTKEHLQLNKHFVTYNKQHSKIKKSQGQCDCNVCGKHFQFPSRLKEHMTVHENEQPSSPNSKWPYQCDVCQKIFLYASRFKTHYKTHAQEKQGSSFSATSSEGRHPRNLCGKAFPYESHLRRHQNSHNKQANSFSEPSSEVRHPCNVCGKNFLFESHRKRHETIHYKREPLNGEPSSRGPFKCDICGMIFQYPSQIREHSIIHKKKKRRSLNNRPHSEGPYHKKQIIEPSTSTHPSEVPYHQPMQEPAAISLHSQGCYQCDVCGNTFKHESFLLRHYVVHERESNDKPYVCAYCGRSFWQTNHLKQHCRKQHNTDKIFSCDNCLAAFDRRTQLKDHLLTCVGKKDSAESKRPVRKQTRKPKDYTENGAFEYETCGEEYTNNSAFQYAEMSVGSSTKQHGSSMKKHGSATSRKGGFQRAKNSTVKSNKKRFTLTTKKKAPTCNICGATFSSNAGLRVHLDIHLDRRPYSCRFCDMKFRQIGHLSAHCRNVHNDYPYQCDLCNMPFNGMVLLKKHQEIAHGVSENPNELDGFEKSVMPQYSNIDDEPRHYTKIVNSKQTEYACGFCDSSARTFKSLSGLRRHITIVHNTTPVSQATFDENGHAHRTWNARGVVNIPREECPVRLGSSEESVYKCNVCSVIVHGWEALEAHEKAHAKKNGNSPSSTPPMSGTFTPPAPSIKQTFECKFCEAEFDSMSREAFDQHQLEHELAAEEPIGTAYICIECDKEFAMAGDLIKHHEEAH